MHQAISAYAQTAKKTLPPRELEASLLLKAAGYLQEVLDNWPNSRPYLDGALYYNRRLWVVLVDTCTKDENPLPLEIRSNVANLGIFVFKRTIEIQTAPDPQKLTVLININKQLAAGLSSKIEG